jgi:hypothetical protein
MQGKGPGREEVLCLEILEFGEARQGSVGSISCFHHGVSEVSNHQ